jgi:hypothetical protein
MELPSVVAIPTARMCDLNMVKLLFHRILLLAIALCGQQRLYCSVIQTLVTLSMVARAV